ncbi:MAG: Hsp70 family protein [Thermoguttaceae bacterium]|nr:Hsp70 family protein [Thermoguttaceae bacterium]
MIIVGIDLGTTNSAIAYMTDNGPKLIPNSLGKTLTPSAVGLDSDGTVIVGDAAKDFMVVHPDLGTTAFKRLMGTSEIVKIGDQNFLPVQLSAMILRSLKNDAEHYFGHSDFQAVITVPAYFNDAQRQATIHAAQVAELSVVRLLNEPTAASMAYGFHESEEAKNLLIVDLGGGTFDVSAVELFDGVVDVKASFGDSFLGGEDFTHIIVAEILKSRNMRFEETEFKFPKMVSRLKHECEKAKIALSSQDNATVRIPREDGTFDEELTPENTFTVWREQFELWTKDLLERLEKPIQRVLADANWSTSVVDETILVGGSTRMPMVRNMMSEMFGFEPQCRLNPDEVVALGAAIQGGLFANDKALTDMAVTDIAPFTLGVEVTKEFGREYKPGYMLPIINRNRKIPSTQVKRVSTIFPNQKEITVKVYQGEGRRVSQCTFLGEFAVKDIPPGKEGQEIDIRFSYDLNGVLEVEATVVATGKTTRFVITSNSRNLTQEEIDDSIERLHQLKPSPREMERWKALLKRAEREYEERPFVAREFLSKYMDRFEAALMDGSDKKEIELVASQLEFLLNSSSIELTDEDEGDDNFDDFDEFSDLFKKGDFDADNEDFDTGDGGYDDGYGDDEEDHGDDWKNR